MVSLLWLIPTFPLAGFLALALSGRRLSKRAIGWIGVGAVGLSAAAGALVGMAFVASPSGADGYSQTLWTWMGIPGLSVQVGLHLDGLAVVMVWVVTGVGFLIHLYSSGFMAEDPDYARFFAYMNLFVASMLVLVLADNLLLLYLGWEGVGLCSYLLIGFWYREPENCRSAVKAFVVTRVGDAAMLIGLILLATEFRTLNIGELMGRAGNEWPVGAPLATAAAALLLAGAVGKSAQLPLQVWLPNAMVGPTPVSALIHAATMVTAGVYLVARTHVLFALAPAVSLAVAAIGLATLLLAGASALAQRDIKRILAYSTMCQVGYMFLALDVGAWGAAVFHLVTHAFFKALLFLGAGVVIKALHEEHDIYAMGGLRRQLPVAFWTFLIGAASLAGLPLVTAGFYSKDMILLAAWSWPGYGPYLWAGALLGAVVTGLYAFRAVFVVFYGSERREPERGLSWAMRWPLVTLAGLSLLGGFVWTPGGLGGIGLLGRLLSVEAGDPSYGHGPETPAGGAPAWLFLAAAAASLAGIAVAWLLYVRYRERLGTVAGAPAWAAVRSFVHDGFGFDALYGSMLVQPFVYLARANAGDLIDRFYDGVAAVVRLGYSLLSYTQNGRVRWYAAGMAVGAVLLLGAIVLR